MWGWHNTGVKGKVSFYSQGMRQQLYLQYHGEEGRRHGILVSDRSVPDLLWTQADFCFSASGAGCVLPYRSRLCTCLLDCLLTCLLACLLTYLLSSAALPQPAVHLLACLLAYLLSSAALPQLAVHLLACLLTYLLTK